MYLIFFWLISGIFWFPFFKMFAEVYTEITNNPIEIVFIITPIVCLLVGPIGWILFPMYIILYLISKDKNITIKKIMYEKITEKINK
jgi:hypothetical protein